jgi:predicted Fe-S protein YdhL (DUF1289 family)
MMQLTQHSKNRLIGTFRTFRVPSDFSDPMYNYLVHGFNPGSCFTSVLANDLYSAIRRSHSCNTIDAFKSLVEWLKYAAPNVCQGCYAAVDSWSKLDETSRRQVLQDCQLIYSTKQELLLAIKDPSPDELVLF